MEFGIKDTDCGGADILKSIELVTTDGHANAVRFCFTWAHGADEVGVGDLATSWNCSGSNEKDGAIIGHLM
jgi:hypothetical protein